MLRKSAQFVMAQFLLSGDGVPANTFQAVRLLYSAAARGSSQSMAALGKMYLEGDDGIPRNCKQGIKWLKASVACAQPADQTRFAIFDLLACSYLNGIEVERNLPLAEKWLQRAIEGGYVHSMTHLGQIYCDEDFDSSKKSEGLQLIRRAADLGDARGQMCWANIVFNGKNGEAQNTEEYLVWVRRAAEQDLADAEYSLAFELRTGRFLQADLVGARMWAEKAAQQGKPEACHLLAEMLLAGEGGEKDTERYVELVRKAAKSGVPGAEYAMASFYSQGMPGFPQDALSHVQRNY
jgi:hypothetical protein